MDFVSEVGKQCRTVDSDLKKIKIFRQYYAEVKGFKFPEASSELIEKMKVEDEKLELCEIIGNTLLEIASFETDKGFPPEANSTINLYLSSKEQLGNLNTLQSEFLELKQKNIDSLAAFGGILNTKELYINGIFSLAVEKYCKVYKVSSVKVMTTTIASLNGVIDDRLASYNIVNIDNNSKKLSEFEKTQISEKLHKEQFYTNAYPYNTSK